ncbi:MAG: hypothetical protein U9Q16_00745 [Patescibacteria group bacterium]|nr:hypothetical protein [Patescibacteria group bacterium]
MSKRNTKQDIYKELKTNELILFCIDSLAKDTGKCSFQNLLKESFALRPDIFRFPNIPQWPDSRKIDRPLRTLRKRKLITGSPQTFFSLTKKGKIMAKEIAKTFRQRKLKL